MKTAVSIPDPLFRKAEREAKRRGMSRSALYAEALKAHLAKPTNRPKLSDREITRRINEVCAEVDTNADPFLTRAASLIMEKVEW
jgi:metal-responsive CopG/Arc/MetJ family transcriptional regulator